MFYNCVIPINLVVLFKKVLMFFFLGIINIRTIVLAAYLGNLPIPVGFLCHIGRKNDDILLIMPQVNDVADKSANPGVGA